LTFTPLEIAGIVFVLVNVILAVMENIWTWPTGIVGVLLYLVINWRAHLYANAILQILYFVLSIHGWYEWLHGGRHRDEREVTAATPKVWAVTIGGGIALTLPIWYFLVRSGSSSSPVMDATTTAYSLVGQVLLNLKYISNWIIWIAVDVVTVVMYAQQRLYASGILYIILAGWCVVGYFGWRRSLATLAARANPAARQGSPY